MIRASTLDPQCPPFQSQLFAQTSNKSHPILHHCPPLSPPHSVEKANEVWTTNAFSSIFLRLRIQDNLPPTSFLTGGSHVVAYIYRSLALSTFIIFSTLVTYSIFVILSTFIFSFCHLLTLANKILTPVLSIARTLRQYTFPNNRCLWSSCHSDFEGSRRGWGLILIKSPHPSLNKRFVVMLYFISLYFLLLPLSFHKPNSPQA